MLTVTTPDRPTGRSRRALTLIELTVTLVILALLAGVAAFGYQSVVINAQTRATSIALTQMHKIAMSAAVTAGRPVTLADFQAAANEVPQLSAMALPADRPMAAQGTVTIVTGSEKSNGQGVVAVTIEHGDTGKVGIAGESAHGACVTLYGVGMTVVKHVGAPRCSGDEALGGGEQGPVGSTPLDGAPTNPTPTSTGTPTTPATADPVPTPTQTDGTPTGTATTTPATPAETTTTTPSGGSNTPTPSTSSPAPAKLPSQMGVTTYTTSGLGSHLWGDLIYAQGKFVAFGDQAAATSPDGKTWTVTTTAQPWSNIVGLAYGNNIYVAVASGGVVYTSTDAKAWTKSTNGLGNGTVDLVFADGMFIAVSEQKNMFVSTDGLTWSSQGSRPSNGCLMTTAGRWVQMPGADNFNPARTSTTPDVAASWTAIAAIPTGYGYYKPWVCAAGNGRFVAGTTNGSLVRTSTDATNWTSTTTFTPNALIYAGGEFVALSGTTMRTSTDGTAWASKDMGASMNPYLYGAYGGGRMVFIGSAGQVLVAE